MKKNTLFLVLICFSFNQIFAQSGTWTWMKGSNNNIAPGLGNYGTMGVPNIINEPPGRYQAAYWTDLQGNFWIYGGVNMSVVGELNDLWKYDVASNIWTWIGGSQFTGQTPNYGTQGVPSPTNWPGSLGWGSNCWTDHNGDLWLFGGAGIIGYSDQLWRYNIASNQWTWMKGTNFSGQTGIFGTMGIGNINNNPPGLGETKSSYVDNQNNLWLFGGAINFGSEMNTLWKYDIATNMWTWMNGSSIPGASGNYGTINVPNANNQPPSRWSYTKWVDQNGNFYLFSGDGVTNDTWRYNPSTNIWTWIGGNLTTNDTGIINGNCVNTSYPAPALENRTVQSFGCGNYFWEFGGCNSNLGVSIYNSLWFYDASLNKWNLVSGHQYTDNGSYGIKGVTNASNNIPSRLGHCMWLDKNSNVWIFGGAYFDTISSMSFNDLWRYTPDTACIHIPLSAFANNPISLPQDLFWCSARDTAINTNGAHIISVNPANSVSFNSDTSQINFHPTSTTTYTIVVTGGCAGTDTLTESFTINYINTTLADFSVSSPTAYLSNPTIVFSNLTPASAIAWYVDGVLVSNSTTSLPFTFKGLGEHCIKMIAYYNTGCIDSVTKCINIIDQNNIELPSAFSPNGDNRNDVFYPIIYGDVIINKFEIYNRWGQLVYSDKNTGWDGMFKNKAQPSEVYVYVVEANKMNNTTKNYETIVLKGNVTLIR